ncbi:hypothetical protein [Microbispora sp. NPDC049633]|uniref:hypothetical protein n=1 Tax=Microbispora sp. NPDC049633 TaxID=3154355 RepID=UPI003423B5A0
MRDILKIEDLPAGVTELAGADLETVAGIDVVMASDEIVADLKPSSPSVCTASQRGDCWTS